MLSTWPQYFIKLVKYSTKNNNYKLERKMWEPIREAEKIFLPILLKHKSRAKAKTKTSKMQHFLRDFGKAREVNYQSSHLPLPPL